MAPYSFSVIFPASLQLIIIIVILLALLTAWFCSTRSLFFILFSCL